MKALKGRDIPAQGNALGNGPRMTSPVGAGYSPGNWVYLQMIGRAFSPRFLDLPAVLGLHPRLGWGAPVALCVLSDESD